ncbi:MAG: histidine phosphatase family protein [Thiolinea sp.]
MAAIYLIRHGQASFDAADYDQLSETGYKQAQILGEYWHSLPHPTPEQIYRGDMLRHQQTLDQFLCNSKKEFPVDIHQGFNEFNHIEVLKRYRQDWSELQGLKDFEREFFSAFHRWQSGQFDDDYQESWPQFKQRCITALNDIITRAGTAKTILVFTSGGTISVILQHIMQLSDQQAMRINQQIRNTSLTRLLFSGSRLSVDYMNNFSHLEQAGAEWVTYR